MGVSLSGMVSGLDLNSIIDQLVGIENNRVVTVKQQKTVNQVKIDAYSRLQSLISDLSTKGKDLQKEEKFNLFKITTTNDAIANFEASTGSVEGKYQIKNYQLAQVEKMISTNGLITDQKALLTNYGVTPGDISINGVTISVRATDTIQDLRMRINNAKQADGKALGVTASVLKVADNNFRLVLTSAKTGDTGIVYRDLLAGNTLQALGIIGDAAGTKGNETQIITSANNFSTAFTDLAVGQSIAFNGTDREGNTVSNMFIKSANSTLADFLTQVEQTFHGMVTATASTAGTQAQVLASSNDFSAAFSALADDETIAYNGTDRNGLAVSNVFVKTAGSTIDDFLAQLQQTYNSAVSATIAGNGRLTITDGTAGMSQLSMSSLTIGGVAETVSVAQAGQNGDGRLTITDKVTGASQLNISSLTIGGVPEAVAISQAGRNGDGVLSVGRKAYFAIDGITMESESNTVTSAINGVTMNLLKADYDETVDVELKRDLDGITEKVKKMFDAYNALVRFQKENTSYGNPTDEKDTSKGDLAGDMTVRSIVSRFRAALQTSFESIGGEYETISQLGVKTNTGTGEYTIDATVFKEALAAHFEDVVSLFATKGFSGNANMSMGRFTDTTTAGVYDLEEADATHMRIRLQGDPQWYTSTARFNDVVTFEDGPAKGLSMTAPAGLLGGVATTFTFSQGLGDLIANTAKDVTDPNDGIVMVRQKSLRDGMKRMDQRITRLSISVEAYRQRLIKQFTAMEQSMSQMKAQSGGMTSALSGL
jgi:flagellar capping protein FliD